jgi:aminoglycoside 3-N-acetyltransferase
VVAARKLTRQLDALGVERGRILLVHTSFSRVRPVDGGPNGLIDALLTAIGPDGTLVMPSMTDDDDHVFDSLRTPCLGMGVVADVFWRRPGALRSDSPHAFAAVGPMAAAITADHPPDVPHGLDSPVGRVHERDGQILLLGVGHDANTTVHLAENLAGVRYRRAKHLMLLSSNGTPTRVKYAETDHCCQNFALMDRWLEEVGLQQRGVVGSGEARLMRSRDVVQVAADHLREDETAFLHPLGVDHECDEARASIPAASFTIRRST